MLFLITSYSLKKYEDYVYRAITYESLFLRKKAIQTMNVAIKQQFSKKEKASGFIYLGKLYIPKRRKTVKHQNAIIKDLN